MLCDCCRVRGRSVVFGRCGDYVENRSEICAWRWWLFYRIDPAVMKDEENIAKKLEIGFKIQ